MDVKFIVVQEMDSQGWVQIVDANILRRSDRKKSVHIFSFTIYRENKTEWIILPQQGNRPRKKKTD